MSSFDYLTVQKKIAGFFVFLFIFCILFVSLPSKKASAQWVVHDPLHAVISSITAGATPISAGSNTISAGNSTLQVFKDYILKPLAFALAKNILQGITAQTVNWINGGFNGNPAYVTNPEQFFLNVGDRSVVDALGQNGSLLSKICTPFQPQIRLALVQQYLQQQDQLQQCSLSQIVKNYDGFINNFENGGWDAWFSITQNQQNNPYGAYIAAQDQLQLSISNQTEKYNKQLTQNGGFLSYEKCDAKAAIVAGTTTSYDQEEDPATGEITETDRTVPTSSGGGCIHTTTVTPGSVINDELKKSLGAGIDKLNVATDINQILDALLTKAFTSIVGGISGGLRGLSQSSQSSSNNRSAIQQILDQSQNASAASTTIANIDASLPGSLVDLIGPGSTSTPLTPTLDEAALQANIDAKAAEIQNQGILYGNQINSTFVATTSQIFNTTGGVNSSPGPVCGNNVCDQNETAQSCPADCTITGTGRPNPTPSTGNVCADAFNQCSSTPGRTDCNDQVRTCLQATQTPPQNAKP